MLARFVYHRRAARIVLLTRSLSLKSDGHLGIQMKLLNDKKDYKKTLELFDKNSKENSIETLSNLTVLQLLKACAQMHDLKRGLTIQKNISSNVRNNSYVLASFIHLYMQCGDIVRPQEIFDTVKNKTLGMYGAMMKGFVKNNTAQKAIDLYNKITVPDVITTTFFFNACAQLGNEEALNLVKKVSQEMPKSFLLDHILLTSYLDACMKCGDVPFAESLFNNSKKKTVAMHGAMMKGYVKNNMMKKAIDLYSQITIPDEITTTIFFNACAQLGTNEALDLVKKISKRMPKSFQSDHILLVSLLDAFIKCKDCSSAELIFSKMKTKCPIAYGNLMSGFLNENNPEKALYLFNQMKNDGIKVNEVIYLSVIKALSEVGDYSLCKSIVDEIPKYILFDNQIQNCIIHMWGKIGYPYEAKEVFENLSQPDRISYTTMINAYGLNGMGIEAIEIYSKMPAQFIHEATYVCILNACSHSGLIETGRSIFKNIETRTVKIYTAMIDCLSRGYFFDEAQELVDEFERDNPPSWPMYMALLSGTRNDKNSLLSKSIQNRMKKEFPDLINELAMSEILLANTYGSSGEIDEAFNIRRRLTLSGVKKTVGLSWTIINGQIFRFRSHDQKNHRASDIHAEMQKISNEVKERGYQYDSSWITRPLNPDETEESVLDGHSERLAIAFNFVMNPHTSLIELKQNLRICSDCHRFIKLIAAIRQCEIIVRDANRIHHFQKNGKCSCNDYF